MVRYSLKALYNDRGGRRYSYLNLISLSENILSLAVISLISVSNILIVPENVILKM